MPAVSASHSEVHGALQTLWQVPWPRSCLLPPASRTNGTYVPFGLGPAGRAGTEGDAAEPGGCKLGGSMQGETAWEKLVLLLPLLYPSCREIPNISRRSRDDRWQLSVRNLHRPRWTRGRGESTLMRKERPPHAGDGVMCIFP